MTEQRRGFIDAFWLKMIMAFLMVLDHLYYRIFPDSLYWGHVAARVVAPMFCYLVTEGMIYTRNRWKYILRMFLFALAMLAGNTILYYITGRWVRNSILMSLAISAAVIACIDKLLEARGAKKLLWLGATAGLFFASFSFEGAYMIPVMAVIFYYLHNRPVAMWAAFAFVFLTPYLLTFIQLGYLDAQFWMILAIIPISLYNGKRGMSGKFAKYFFYVFYPLHIWIIFAIEQVLGR